MHLGPAFERLWTAYAISAIGTWLAFDAFPLVAIRVLDAGPGAVALLATVGPATGAAAAVAIGPWVEFRRKRPVLIGTDLLRGAALAVVPVAFWCERLSVGLLAAVAVIVAGADLAFRAASGAYLKSIVGPDDLVSANGRFEQVSWTATALGPPLGGAAIGLLGPVITVLANAVSFLGSAATLTTIDDAERPPQRTTRRIDLLAGWRCILADPVLRRLCINTALFNASILAGAPPLAVLLLGELGFPPWQYGLAFGVPCIAGFVGARLCARSADRFGGDRVLRVAGTLRAGWPIGLAFIGSGLGGLAAVIAVELGLIGCCAVFNPVLAAARLRRLPADRVARGLTAWSVTNNLTVAGLTLVLGSVAQLTSPRTALLIAGLLALATPLLLRHLADLVATSPTS